jgi:hypothetical protein
MDSLPQLSPVETVVAYFFALTAVATLILTSWAYVYQKRRELKTQHMTRPDNYGEFFIRR